MDLQQAQDTSETMVFTALSEYPRAETGPCQPDELVVGVMMKTVENPQEETGNRYPEELIITPHTS